VSGLILGVPWICGREDDVQGLRCRSSRALADQDDLADFQFYPNSSLHSATMAS